MGSKVEYVDSSHIYASNYVRNSKAIGVLWGIFTICYAIIVVVAFLTPEWMGDTSDSEYPGRFGLWKMCFYGGPSEECLGWLGDPSSVPGLFFKLASGLAAFSILLASATILAIPLFLFLPSTILFKTSAWLQTFSGVSLIGSVGVYPMAWDGELIRRTCGESAGRYALGDCSLRWAYILAAIASLDAFILATLAFILATRHIKLQPEPIYTTNGSLYKGEVNGGFMSDGHSIAGSRKSLNLHPVLLMPQPGDMDRYSEFSNRTGRSKSSAYRPDYASSMQNFQL